VISSCILAGGRGTRLGGGTAKSQLVAGGVSILERQLAVLAPRSEVVLIAIARGAAAWPVSARWADRVRFVEDVVADAGPLAGIAGALAACPTPWLVVVAGDLPHLTGAVVDRLIAAVTDDVDAVAPRIGGLPEPLLAAYRAQVAPIAARRVAAGRRKVAGLLTDEGLRVRWIEEAALREVDPALSCLDDVDTPEDLARLRSE
jgi:molybdenum cofactor guanylyltransferase